MSPRGTKKEGHLEVRSKPNAPSFAVLGKAHMIPRHEKDYLVNSKYSTHWLFVMGVPQGPYDGDLGSAIGLSPTKWALHILILFTSYHSLRSALQKNKKLALVFCTLTTNCKQLRPSCDAHCESIEITVHDDLAMLKIRTLFTEEI